jgi:hypothetical protein
MYAATLAMRCVEKFSQKLTSKKTLSCVFDILYATSEKPGVEGFSFPELQSESSLLVTTGQSIFSSHYRTEADPFRNRHHVQRSRDYSVPSPQPS